MYSNYLVWWTFTNLQWAAGISKKYLISNNSSLVQNNIQTSIREKLNTFKLYLHKQILMILISSGFIDTNAKLKKYKMNMSAMKCWENIM